MNSLSAAFKKMHAKPIFELKYETTDNPINIIGKGQILRSEVKQAYGMPSTHLYKAPGSKLVSSSSSNNALKNTLCASSLIPKH